MLMNREGRLVVVDLSSEVEYSAKNSIVFQIIKRMWDVIIENRRRAGIVAVIDEAHNYCCVHGCNPAKDVIMRTAREGRKWGFGLILASQRVVDLAPEIRGNINSVFFSRLQTAGDYDELRNWIEGVEYMQYTLPFLTPREFFFAGLGNPLRKPILVRVRDVA
jgi:DNA helicase HerA-like ATPase